MLTTGQFATDVHTGKTVQVLESQQVFGMTTYRVYDPDTGKIYNAAESSLTAESCLAQPSAAFVRFAAVWCRVQKCVGSGHGIRCLRKRYSLAAPALRAGACYLHQ